jgi:hypothetical protein
MLLGCFCLCFISKARRKCVNLRHYHRNQIENRGNIIMAKDIEPKLKLIKEYISLAQNENFVIPEYQRGYSWDIPRCDKLWQDIEDYIESGPEDPYFFGTIISDCSNSNEFRLIDGQQRTTTFLLLLKAMLLRLQEVLHNFTHDDDSRALERGLTNNLQKIIELLYKADDEKVVKIEENWDAARGTKILLNKSINEQYKEELSKILDAKDFFEAEANVFKIPRRQKDNKYTNFFRNFKFFYEKLRALNETKLNSFTKTFLNKCQIIEIRSWQIEQAITMFNSLNSTGMPLSDADIISAQLYSNAGDSRLTFNEQWERIKKLTSKLSSRGIVGIDGVLQQYMYIRRAKDKAYVTSGTPNVTTPGLRNYYLTIKKDLLKEPLALCDSFEKITKIWDKVKDYSCVKLLLKFNDNIRIYFISYLYNFNLEDIDISKVQPIAEYLIRLFAILELVDTGYSSSLFKTFLFGENVKLVDPAVTLPEIEGDFNEHINKNWKRSTIMQEIEDYRKNVLVFLNEYLFAKEKGLAFDFSENVNVEHIMPASGRDIEAISTDAGIATKEDFGNLVNMLGNKILLEEDINKSIGRDWFQTKKQKTIAEKSGYKNSSFGIAKALVDYPSDAWTKDDIETATDKVSTRLADFIFGPEK